MDKLLMAIGYASAVIVSTGLILGSIVTLLGWII